MGKPRTEVYQDGAGQWRYRVIGANGEPMAASEAYTRQSDARRGADALRAALGGSDQQPATGRALGRRRNHDPRSLAYPARGATTHRPVTHRTMGVVLDQGQVSSCVGNAAAHALNTHGVHRVPSPLADEAKAVAIYTAATAVDPFPGTYPEQDTGTDANSAASVLRGMGLIGSWSHAFGLDHVIAALQLGPVMLGTEWHSAMFTPDARGFIHPDGAVVGGHETLIRGDDGAGSVLVRNSWGRGWGLAGHFRLTYADLDILLQAQGDATVLTP